LAELFFDIIYAYFDKEEFFMPKIFDFDRTITKQHTFAGKCLKRDGADEGQYALGKLDAKDNTKDGVAALLTHTDEEISAIATYHNNPHYVAGYIAHILEKELTHEKTIFMETPSLAMNFYHVEEVSKPFIISYIPEAGKMFDQTLEVLGNKNKQIEWLRDTMITKGYMLENAIIDFYDDSRPNFEGAKRLKYVNSYWISTTCMVFTVIGTYKAFSSVPQDVIEEERVPSPVLYRNHSVSSGYGVASQGIFSASTASCDEKATLPNENRLN
jgi:hypothetical protein